MSLTLVDVNGLNGSLSYGFVKAGHELVARTGYLGLGQGIVNANASLWGDHWTDQITPELGAADWRSWPLEEVMDRARVVVGVPPCSRRRLLNPR